MLAAVSPYHLTTREPPALAALLLARQAVTFMPSPRGTREEIEEAVSQSPEYLRFMETWAWSMPLWNQGVLASALDDGDDALLDLHHAWKLLQDDERYAPLRPLARTGLFETERDFLDAISRDLLRGGPDPGISLPLSAGIDRFAARRGLVVMRSAPSSVAQKAESHMGRRVFAFAAPLVMQASAERLLSLREFLADELDELASAIGEIASVTADGHDPHDDPSLVANVEHAARAYAHAFESDRDRMLGGGRDDLHIIERTASITAMVLPTDAVLRSGVSAMRSLSRDRKRRAPRPDASVQTMPILADSLGAADVLTLVIKPLGERRPL